MTVQLIVSFSIQITKASKQNYDVVVQAVQRQYIFCTQEFCVLYKSPVYFSEGSEI